MRGNRREAMLYLLSLAMLIVSLDQYIVVVALPDIAKDLGYSARTLQSVVSAYAIASSGFLLLGGRASDLIGRRRILVSGLLLYLVASLAGGLAANSLQQLAARAVQGLGGALVFPSTLALINAGFQEGEERNRALGIWAGAGAAGLVVGVLLGGVLTSVFGWRAVFLVNVPLAGCAVAAAYAVIERDPPREKTRSFDSLGALSITAGITSFVVVLVEGPNIGWTSPLALCLFAIGLMFTTLFVFVEHRSGDPLLPPAMLSNKYLRVALISGALFMATFGSVLYFLSIFFQIVMGFDALQTGFAFLLPTVVVVASSTLAGRAVTRFGLRNVMAFALGFGALGAVALGLMLARGEPLLALVPGLVAISIGDGAMFTAIFIAAATGVPDRHQGVASGMVSTSQGIGASMGLAVLVLVANAAGSGLVGKSLRVATEHGTARVAYAIAAGMLLTLLIVAAFNPMKAQDVARSSAAKQEM